MEENKMESGNPIWNMVSVVRNGQMGPSRKVSGRRTIGTARASLCGPTDPSTRVNSTMTANRATAASCGPRASITKRVLGLKIWNKAAATKCSATAINTTVTTKMAKNTGMDVKNGNQAPFMKVNNATTTWMVKVKFYGETAEDTKVRWTITSAKGMVNSNGKTAQDRLASSKPIEGMVKAE